MTPASKSNTAARACARLRAPFFDFREEDLDLDFALAFRLRAFDFGIFSTLSRTGTGGDLLASEAGPELFEGRKLTREPITCACFDDDDDLGEDFILYNLNQNSLRRPELTSCAY